MLVDEVTPMVELFAVKLNHEAKMHERPGSLTFSVARAVVADIVEELPCAPRGAYR